MASLADIFEQIQGKSNMTQANMTGLMLALRRLSEPQKAEPATQPAPTQKQPVQRPVMRPEPVPYPDWRPVLPKWQPQLAQALPQPAQHNVGEWDMFSLNDLQHGLPLGMTKTIATIETGHIKDWNQRARVKSPAGAIGLMQFMPDTGRQYGLDAAGLRDPARAIPAAGAHLRDLLDMFKRPELAAAAYNAGPGAVRKYGGVPPYRETQKYVRRFKQLLQG